MDVHPAPSVRGDETSGTPPERFVDAVRDALLHIYDLAYLQTHPLAGEVDLTPIAESGRGRALRRVLLDTIEALHPSPGVAVTSRAWRAYRLLELRYIEEHEVADVTEKMALSKSQYHREHHRALEAIAGLLWERRRRDAPAPSDESDATRRDVATELTRREAAHLVHPTAQLVDAAEVLRSVVALLQPLAHRLGAKLRATTPDRLPSIGGDRVALRQALLSILGHALRAADGGTVAVAATPGPGTLEIAIRGAPGWAAGGDLAGVADLEPFLTALGGRATAPDPAGDAPLRLAFPAAEDPVLLVVDNSQDFIDLVGRFLVGQPWDVVGAPDVERALALGRDRAPRAILLDVVLPGRDGWDLLEALKATPSTAAIPVVICSVLDQPEVALSLGAAAYLRKPIDRHRLVETLTRICDPPPGR